jgi:trehalose utilization protein
MGLVLLHSAINARIAEALLGTSCRMSCWRHGDRELIWTVDPGHEIADGLPNPIELPAGEMYGEPLDVPTPDELIFISSFTGGEVFRSGCTWRRGKGKVFYFSPGDQEYPVYHHPDVRRVLANAVRWVNPDLASREAPGPHRRPIGWYETGETLSSEDPRLKELRS